MLVNTFLLTLSLVGAVSAGMYPAKGPVKMLSAKEFKKALKDEQPAMVAFVAPWCGHCQKLTPEYTKAAKSLGPMVKLYAVDCDDQANKQLCTEQGVQGYPTIKSFPRGLKTPPHLFQAERKAASIVDWMTMEVPNRVAALKTKDAIDRWTTKMQAKLPHALLLTSKARTPLMWKVLQMRFGDDISFGAAKDVDGAIAKQYGIQDANGEKSYVLLWQPGSSEPEAYTGTMKFEPLIKYFEGLTGGGRGKDEL